MRGKLSEEKLQEINRKLPAVDDILWLTATSQGVGVRLNDLVAGKNMRVALVCLEDSYHRFSQVKASLHEVYACLAWYLEESPQAPLEFQAAFTAKLYADYTALLLYAAGEDIAAFILYFLGIEKGFGDYIKQPEVQKEFQHKRISSNAAKVGVYIEEILTDHEITEIVSRLHKNANWSKAIKYRNTWVHEQPPIVKNAGIQYRRKPWAEGDDRRSIGLGGGDKHEYTIEELASIMHLAVEAFAEACKQLLAIVIREREQLGEKLDTSGGKVSFQML